MRAKQSIQSLKPDEGEGDTIDSKTFEEDSRWIAQKLHRRKGPLRYRILTLRRAIVILESERDKLGLTPRFSPQDPLVHRGGPR